MESALLTSNHYDLALEKLIERMRQINAFNGAIAALEASDESADIPKPLLPLLKQATTHMCDALPFGLVWGMEWLLSSYRIFMWPTSSLNDRNCSLEAFAMCTRGTRLCQAALADNRQSLGS